MHIVFRVASEVSILYIFACELLAHYYRILRRLLSLIVDHAVEYYC